MRGQSERIQIASIQSRIPPEFRTRILRNNENKKYNCSGPLALQSPRVAYHSNQKLLHQYQH